MKVIYKYPFEVAPVVKLQLPRESEVLRVGLDPAGNPCLWAIVDPLLKDAELILNIYGTGLPILDSGLYLATFNEGPFVWHVFTQSVHTVIPSLINDS